MAAVNGKEKHAMTGYHGEAESALEPLPRRKAELDTEKQERQAEVQRRDAAA